MSGADSGRGLWGLKPPPSKLMTLFCRPISRYCSQVGQVLLHPVIACNATQSESIGVLFHFWWMTVFYLPPIIAHSMPVQIDTVVR